ncbi:hypothetical protein DB43_FQ00020 [Parachlamydia acanthamoebae]|jgi:hypothetical protein|nr:hypothetical protein DB43_FQ00020 [Parachlamydia acanthamoebae]
MKLLILDVFLVRKFKIMEKIQLDNHGDFIERSCKVNNNEELLHYLKKENSPKIKSIALFFSRLGHFLTSLSWVNEEKIKKTYKPLADELESKLIAFEEKTEPYTEEQDKEIKETAKKVSTISKLYLGTRFKAKLEEFMHVDRWNKLSSGPSSRPPAPPRPPRVYGQIGTTDHAPDSAKIDDNSDQPSSQTKPPAPPRPPRVYGQIGATDHAPDSAKIDDNSDRPSSQTKPPAPPRPPRVYGQPLKTDNATDPTKIDSNPDPLPTRSREAPIRQNNANKDEDFLKALEKNRRRAVGDDGDIDNEEEDEVEISVNQDKEVKQPLVKKEGQGQNPIALKIIKEMKARNLVDSQDQPEGVEPETENDDWKV